MSSKQKKIITLILSLVIAALIVLSFYYYSNIYTPAKNDISDRNNITDTIFNVPHDSLSTNILSGISGNPEAIQRINTKKCQSALLNYYESNDLDSNWEIYNTLKDGGPYTASDTVVPDKTPKYTDFAVIIQNARTGKRKAVLFGFNDDETLSWTRDFDVPDERCEETNEVYLILVSKQELTLSVYDYEGDELYKFPMACSNFYGNKERRGDHKTPEGLFPITELLKSDYIPHDFKDGKGEIPGAYGPYFLRLGVPGYIDIGIHGTHDPGSMGKRVTEGCIRLRNEDILKIVPIVCVGTIVIITTSTEDMKVG